MAEYQSLIEIFQEGILPENYYHFSRFNGKQMGQHLLIILQFPFDSSSQPSDHIQHSDECIRREADSICKKKTLKNER